MLKIILIFFYSIYSCHAEYLKCNSSILNSCPDNSKCVANYTNNLSGECECITNYKFNVNYKNSNFEYCIVNHNNNNKNNVDIATTQSARHNDDIVEPPGTHHILGGILIPILFVFLLIGIIYIFKKFRMNKKLRNIFVRKQRPTYEDVVMGNDLDDPPLI